MDTLTLKRSHPVQGKPVAVEVEYNGESAGTLALPFTGWIKLKRILEKGSELDLREGGLLQLKLKVTGTADATKPTVSPVRTAVVKPLQYQSGVSNLAAAEEEDLDIVAAQRQATIDAQRQQTAGVDPAPAPATAADLVRSLRGGE